MKPHPRIRKTAKWGALVLGVVFVAAGAVSTVWAVHAWRNAYDAGLEAGQFNWCGDPPQSYTDAEDEFMWRVDRLPKPSIRWWPMRMTTWGRGEDYTCIPLWIPALAAFGVGGALWRWDVIVTRRAWAGFCPACSYDRAGIALSAPCPECGKAVA